MSFKHIGFAYLMGVSTVIAGLNRGLDKEFVIVGLVIGFAIMCFGFYIEKNGGNQRKSKS